jgi:hypothetical protein
MRKLVVCIFLKILLGYLNQSLRSEEYVAPAGKPRNISKIFVRNPEIRRPIMDLGVGERIA